VCTCPHFACEKGDVVFVLRNMQTLNVADEDLVEHWDGYIFDSHEHGKLIPPFPKEECKFDPAMMVIPLATQMGKRTTFAFWIIEIAFCLRPPATLSVERPFWLTMVQSTTNLLGWSVDNDGWTFNAENNVDEIAITTSNAVSVDAQC